MSSDANALPSPALGGDAALLLLLKARTFIALFAVFVFFALAAPNFLSVANMAILAKHVALNAILAIGMTFVIITGGIDLSVGSIVGLCGMVAGYLVLHGIDLAFLGFGYTLWFNTFEIIGLALLVGIAGRRGQRPAHHPAERRAVHRDARHALRRARPGAALVGRRDLPEPERQPGLRLGELPGARRGEPPRHHLADLDHDRAGAAPRPTWRARTPLGRYIYAVGGNERSAALSGVKVNRVKMFVYMFSGFCAAIVGLIITSQLVAAHPATGETFELNAIAAAVLGGTSMSGGRGRIGGTVIGAFVIGILADGLVMMGVSSFWQTVIKGLVIIAAVVVDQAQQRLQASVALRRQAALGR